MALHPSIDRPLDPDRINGLVGEDRIRTTRMFLRGNVAWHPTHPIDISPEADLIQGLPTHVKTVKQTYTSKGKPERLTVDMACAHQLFSHSGPHRLIVMVYEPDYEEITGPDGKTIKRIIRHYENGKPVKVLRYDRIVEIIITDETWRKMRGGVTRVEIGRLRSLLLAWKPRVSNEEEARIEERKARDRFHPMTHAMRERQGLARPSVKITIALKKRKNKPDEWKPDNKRVQSAITLDDFMDEVRKEDGGSNLYRGRIDQPRVIEYRSGLEGKDDFHGLKLPWRTTGKWDRPAKIGRTYAKIAAPEITDEITGDARYTQAWEKVTGVSIPDCQLTIMKHKDDMITLYADSADDEVLKHVSRVCRHVGGRWLDQARCWLLDWNAAKRAVASLKPRQLMPMPAESCLRSVPSNPSLFKFETPDGMVMALKLEKDNWVIKPDNRPRNAREKAALQIRIDAACRAASILSSVNGLPPIGIWYHNEKLEQWNWLITQNPEDAIERVAASIAAFDHLGDPHPAVVRMAARTM